MVGAERTVNMNVATTCWPVVWPDRSANTTKERRSRSPADLSSACPVGCSSRSRRHRVDRDRSSAKARPSSRKRLRRARASVLSAARANYLLLLGYHEPRLIRGLTPSILQDRGSSRVGRTYGDCETVRLIDNRKTAFAVLRNPPELVRTTVDSPLSCRASGGGIPVTIKRRVATHICNRVITAADACYFPK